MKTKTSKSNPILNDSLEFTWTHIKKSSLTSGREIETTPLSISFPYVNLMYTLLIHLFHSEKTTKILCLT